jgi:hypothetical protein
MLILHPHTAYFMSVKDERYIWGIHSLMAQH